MAANKDTETPKPKAKKPSEGYKPSPKEIPKEIGGRKDGLEPTRYGDWEKNGRCIDF